MCAARPNYECVGSALALPKGIERIQSEMPVQPFLGGSGGSRVPGPLVRSESRCGSRAAHRLLDRVEHGH